jgi:hypothetical protein
MDPKTQATLDALKAAQANGTPESLGKTSTYAQSGSATSGITAYDLEAGAKLLYPVLTPIRNMLPRVSGKGGIQANWRGVIGINTNNQYAGVSPGNRGGMMNVTTKDYIAVYRGLGMEAAVDFEADYAADGFDDVKALAVKQLLESVMIQEEQIILGGNNALALGTTPTPSLTGETTGGTLAAQAWSVIAVALTLAGIQHTTVDVNGVPGQVTRTNTDGSTDVFGGGNARQSTNATVTTTTATSSIVASVANVPGAFGYAWYLGAAGAERIVAVTALSTVVLTAAPAGANQLASAIPGGATDQSQNALVFDGLLGLAVNPANGAYYQALSNGTGGTGTAFTPDGAGGIVEIDAALKWFWDNYRLSPDVIWVNSQEQESISKIILQGTTTAAQRFVFTVDQGAIAGGVSVVSYRNKFTMNGAAEIPIKLHPNMPAGTILFYTNKLPYPMSNVSNVAQIRTRREYYQIDWPLRSRRWEYGVYADEVLQHFFTPSLGVITNIAPYTA